MIGKMNEEGAPLVVPMDGYLLFPKYPSAQRTELPLLLILAKYTISQYRCSKTRKQPIAGVRVVKVDF